MLIIGSDKFFILNCLITNKENLCHAHQEHIISVSIILFLIENPLRANSVDPDETSRSAVSDLGLHCSPMFHK